MYLKIIAIDNFKKGVSMVDVNEGPISPSLSGIATFLIAYGTYLVDKSVIEGIICIIIGLMIYIIKVKYRLNNEDERA